MQRPLLLASVVLAFLMFTALGCKEATLEPKIAGDIEGQVFEADTEEPISGVEITTSPPSDVRVTGDDGTFEIDDLEIGDYTVRARKSGYEDRSVTVAVNENRTSEATLFMEEDAEAETERSLDAEVTNWTHFTEDADTYVRVEYRIRNTGEETIPAYEVTFRIETDDGGESFEQVDDTDLQVGQSDVDEFEKNLADTEAAEVEVDEVWIEE